MALDDHRNSEAAVRREEASLLRRERLMSHSGTRTGPGLGRPPGAPVSPIRRHPRPRQSRAPAEGFQPDRVAVGKPTGRSDLWVSLPPVVLLGRRYPARDAALLPDTGQSPADRVRQRDRRGESHSLRVARLPQRLRPRPAGRPLRAGAHHRTPPDQPTDVIGRRRIRCGCRGTGPTPQSQPGAAVALAQRDGRGAVLFSASSRRWISISSSRYR